MEEETKQREQSEDNLLNLVKDVADQLKNSLAEEKYERELVENKFLEVLDQTIAKINRKI